jgi:hypothetical protein
MIRFIHALAILLLLQIGQSFSLRAQDIPLVLTDTLNWDNYHQGTEILYESPNGGYVLGNNGYGDLAKAQLFDFPNFGKLEKVLFKFGAKKYNSNDPNSHLIVQFFAVDGLGIDAFGDTSDAPGSDLSLVYNNDVVLTFTDTIFVADIDTAGGFTTIDIPKADTANFTYSIFAVSMGMTGLSLGDTVGLFSTSNGDANLADNSWDKHANGNWVSVLNEQIGWDLDIDMAIFPIFKYDDSSLVDVQENGLTPFITYPNPVSSFITVKSTIGVDSENLTLYSMDGRPVLQIGSKEWTNGQVQIDVRSLNQGIYFIKSLNSGASFPKIIQIIR